MLKGQDQAKSGTIQSSGNAAAWTEKPGVASEQYQKPKTSSKDVLHALSKLPSEPTLGRSCVSRLVCFGSHASRLHKTWPKPRGLTQTTNHAVTPREYFV